MKLTGKVIGFGLTGSHCTISKVIPQIQKIVDEGANVIPIISENIVTTNTRFGEASYWQKQIQEITGNKVITTIVDAEPIGPQRLLDLMVIAPATGNTISKLANAITDTSVLMAAKANLRNLKPLVIAISTNDGLGMNSQNIGKLISAKNIFIVPFGQDSPYKKSNSLVSKMDLIKETCEAALEYQQIQPLIIENL